MAQARQKHTDNVGTQLETLRRSMSVLMHNTEKLLQLDSGNQLDTVPLLSTKSEKYSISSEC